MARSRRRVLTNGEMLIAEGTLATKLYIVVSGEAAVYRSLAGREEVIARLKPGATVGEVGIVDSAPRSAKVVADGATVILEIEHKILEEVPEGLLMKLYRNLALILATRLRGTNDMLDVVAQRSPGGMDAGDSTVPSLQESSMVGVMAQGADFSEGDFRGANFRDASFEGAVFTNADFRGADLAGVTLDEDFLIGADEDSEDGPVVARPASGPDLDDDEVDSLAASLIRRDDS